MSTATKTAAPSKAPTTEGATKKADTKAAVLRILFYALVVVIIVFNLFPFFWALLSSFRPSNELFSTKLIPSALTLDHYVEVFKEARFVQSLINSVIVAGCTVLIALGLGSVCAYALGRLPFRFKGPVLYIVLTMTMIPQNAILFCLLFFFYTQRA